MPRFFAFGCSFTNYNWPTWADILGSQFDYYENWGQIGAGNQYILNSLVECHVKNNITAADTVGIMWSNVSRLDTYKNKQWTTPGNIYTQYQYPDTVKELFDTRGFYIRDLAAMYMADNLLEQIGCKHFIFSMVDIVNPLQYEHNNAYFDIHDVLAFYKKSLNKIKPSVHAVVFNHDWYSRSFHAENSYKELEKYYLKLAGPDWPRFSQLFDPVALSNTKKPILKEIFNLRKNDWKKLLYRTKRIDNHPTPLEHLEYLIKVLPEFELSQETMKKLTEINAQLENDFTVKISFGKRQYTNRW